VLVIRAVHHLVFGQDAAHPGGYRGSARWTWQVELLYMIVLTDELKVESWDIRTSHTNNSVQQFEDGHPLSDHGQLPGPAWNVNGADD
jgi:hypothetical protein